MTELYSLTLEDAISGLKKKFFSAKELVSSCLERIKKVDEEIKSFVTVSENALLEAEKISDVPSEDKPLLGIPIAVKDNFLTKGLRTTASSLVLEDFWPTYESTVTHRLKEAGAIIIGKTNMDAWAHGSSTETSQFFTTKNPWNLERLPGGSSGGSAAAIAADLAIAAIGSETAGSIRQPAAWCGVTGFKPSYGAVSRFGLIAMASSTDSPGPITKSAKDARLLFNIICGKDPNDATSVELNLKRPKEISKIVIGIPREYFSAEVDEEIKEKTKMALNFFEKLGAKTKEVSLMDPRLSISVYTIVQRSEVSSNLARYDGIRFGKDRSYFGDEAKRRIMLGTYSLSSGYYDAYYLRAEKVRALIVEDFKKIFEKVDVLFSPTTPTVALPVGSTKNSSMFGEIADVLVEASSLAGLPGINLNVGFSKEGLPIGAQIVGPKFSEYQLLDLAEKYQELTNWHTIKPKLKI